MAADAAIAKVAVVTPAAAISFFLLLLVQLQQPLPLGGAAGLPTLMLSLSPPHQLVVLAPMPP